MNEEERAELLEGVAKKIFGSCIMELKLDLLHFVLLAIVVLLAVYCAVGALRERESMAGRNVNRMFQRLGLLSII